MAYVQPQRELTHDGKTQTLGMWAKELGITSGGMSTRLWRHEQGKLSLEDVFAPSANLTKPTPVKPTTVNELKRKALTKLFKAIDKHAVPEIDGEMKRYMEGVEKVKDNGQTYTVHEFGPALKLFEKLHKYFPLERIAETSEAKTALAQVALVIQHNGQTDPPTYLTRIEDK